MRAQRAASPLFSLLDNLADLADAWDRAGASDGSPTTPVHTTTDTEPHATAPSAAESTTGPAGHAS